MSALEGLWLEKLQPYGKEGSARVFVPHTSILGTTEAGSDNPQLLRHNNQTSLEQQFRTLILLCADSTFEELRRQVSFGPGSVPKDVDGHLKDAVQFLTVPTEPVEVVFNYLDSVLCGAEEVEW